MTLPLQSGDDCHLLLWTYLECRIYTVEWLFKTSETCAAIHYCNYHLCATWCETMQAIGFRPREEAMNHKSPVCFIQILKACPRKDCSFLKHLCLLISFQEGKLSSRNPNSTENIQLLTDMFRYQHSISGQHLQHWVECQRVTASNQV